MTNYPPKVSVIMPVFNGEEYVREAVSSILNQTFDDFELIIVNDGSTDGTASILEDLSSDSRIKVITNPSNVGLTITRNRGFARCTGSYIAMLDSDDIALPDRLLKQVQFLDANPTFALVGSNIDLVSSDGKILGVQRYKAEPGFISSILLYQNYFAQSTVMLRRDALPEILYRESFPLSEDYDLWVRLASKHKVANLQETLVKYRIHTNNISSTKASLLRDAIKAIIKYQLENLKIYATEEELELHINIGLLEISKDKLFISKAEKWLLKLIDANIKFNVYPNHNFEIVSTKKWFEVCKTSHLGVWAILKFMQSPITKRKNLFYLIRAKLAGNLF